MANRYFSQAELEEKFDEIMEYCDAGDHIFVTKDGVPIVVMIPMSDYETLNSV